MDLPDKVSTAQAEDSAEQALEAFPQSPQKLPDDLPTSLDDRRPFPSYGGETEMYDAWQGNSHLLSKQLPSTLMVLCNRLIPIPYYPNSREATCV